MQVQRERFSALRARGEKDLVLPQEVMLALTRQEEREKPVDGPLDLCSDSESCISFCRGERLFAQKSTDKGTRAAVSQIIHPGPVQKHEDNKVRGRYE